MKSKKLFPGFERRSTFNGGNCYTTSISYASLSASLNSYIYIYIYIFVRVYILLRFRLFLRACTCVYVRCGSNFNFDTKYLQYQKVFLVLIRNVYCCDKSNRSTSLMHWIYVVRSNISYLLIQSFSLLPSITPSLLSPSLQYNIYIYIYIYIYI